MAFFGMVLGMVLGVVFMIMAVIMIVFLVTAFILKSLAKRKQRPWMRVVGNVLLVIGIVLAIPVVFIIQCMKKLLCRVEIRFISQKWI